MTCRRSRHDGAYLGHTSIIRYTHHLLLQGVCVPLLGKGVHLAPDGVNVGHSLGLTQLLDELVNHGDLLGVGDGAEAGTVAVALSKMRVLMDKP